MPEAILIKLGGSLITEKRRSGVARVEVITRLAGEIARAGSGTGGRERLVLGHGSGSFGHVAAARHGLAGGLRPVRELAEVEPTHPRAAETPAGVSQRRDADSAAGAAQQGHADQLAGVASTQQRAADLHRRVVAALRRAGAFPFSIAPSSAVVFAGGEPVAFSGEPLRLALEAGLLPVLYGDVVTDREQGIAICATERALELAARELPGWGYPVRRAIWLGETAGLLDERGQTVPRISPEELETLLAGRLPGIAGGSGDSGDAAPAGADLHDAPEAASSPASESPGAAAEPARSLSGALRPADGTDVTGGMRLRLATTLALARLGIESLLADGRVPGLLESALAGERVPGTIVTAREDWKRRE